MAEKRRFTPEQFKGFIADHNAQLSAARPKHGDPYGAGEEGPPEEGYYKEANRLTENPILNFFIGGAKRGGQYALNLGGAVRNNPAYTFGVLHRMGLEKDPLSDVAMAGRPEDPKRKQFSMFNAEGQRAMGLEPKGTAQQLGAGAFDIGTSFVPSGMITRGVGTAGRIATNPALRKGIEAAARTGLEAISSGTQAALRGDDPGSAAATSVPFTLFGQALDPWARKLAPSMRNWAVNTYSKIFSPSNADEKARALKASSEIIDQGMPDGGGRFTPSRGALERRAGREIAGKMQEQAEEINRLGPQIGNLSGPDTFMLTTNNILDSMDQSFQRELQAVNKMTGATSNLSSFAGAAQRELEALKSLIREQSVGGMIPYASAEKFKNHWQTFVANLGGYGKKTMPDFISNAHAQAMMIGEGAIRDEIMSAAPNITNINKVTSFWLNVKNTLEDARFRKVGQMQRQGMALMGGEGEMAQRLARYGAYRQALSALQRTVTSAAWISASASAKAALARALARGEFATVMNIAGRIAAVGGGQSGNEEMVWTPGGLVPASEAGEYEIPTYRVTSRAKRPK